MSAESCVGREFGDEQCLFAISLCCTLCISGTSVCDVAAADCRVGIQKGNYFEFRITQTIMTVGCLVSQFQKVFFLGFAVSEAEYSVVVTLSFVIIFCSSSLSSW